MWEVQGNREAQELIRIRTPAVDHCHKLKVSAYACKGCEHRPNRDREDVAVSPEHLNLIPKYEPEITAAINRIGLMDAAGIQWTPGQADLRLSKLMVIARALISGASRSN